MDYTNLLMVPDGQTEVAQEVVSVAKVTTCTTLTCLVTKLF